MRMHPTIRMAEAFFLYLTIEGRVPIRKKNQFCISFVVRVARDCEIDCKDVWNEHDVPEFVLLKYSLIRKGYIQRVDNEYILTQKGIDAHTSKNFSQLEADLRGDSEILFYERNWNPLHLYELKDYGRWVF